MSKQTDKQIEERNDQFQAEVQKAVDKVVAKFGGKSLGGVVEARCGDVVYCADLVPDDEEAES